MVFGFMLAFPVIAFQMYRFIAPGLYRTEKSAFLPFLIASPVMFLLGAAFAHFVVTPLAMAFFLALPMSARSLPTCSIQRWIKSPIRRLCCRMAPLCPQTAEGLRITFFGKVNESLDITLKFIIAFGLCFQLPVLLTLMARPGWSVQRVWARFVNTPWSAFWYWPRWSLRQMSSPK